MKKGEIATSTIIWITIGLIVLVLIIGGVVMKIVDGQGQINIKECQVTEDADEDGTPDAIDPCPCEGINGASLGSKECFTCDKYKTCDEGS